MKSVLEEKRRKALLGIMRFLSCGFDEAKGVDKEKVTIENIKGAIIEEELEKTLPVSIETSYWYTVLSSDQYPIHARLREGNLIKIHNLDIGLGEESITTILNKGIKALFEKKPTSDPKPVNFGNCYLCNRDNKGIEKVVKRVRVERFMYADGHYGSSCLGGNDSIGYFHFHPKCYNFIHNISSKRFVKRSFEGMMANLGRAKTNGDVRKILKKYRR